MKISAKQITLALLVCLSFLPGMAKAACNNANGYTFVLEIGGYTDTEVDVGVTNTFTLRIFSDYSGAYLPSSDIDTSAITWVPGVFTVVDSNGDGVVNSYDYHQVSIKLVAGASAASSSPTDLKAIVCQYNAPGWSTDGVAGCQASTAKFVVADTDGDGLPDWWENTNGYDPDDPSDVLDDTDSDGLSDAWEDWFFGNLNQNAQGDPDGDGLLTGYEMRWYPDNTIVIYSDPSLYDTDGEGLNDGAEDTANTDPFLGDTDGDTRNDAYELLTIHTDPNNPDIVSPSVTLK